MLNHPFDPEWDTDKSWKAIPEEIMDVLDGPEQECQPIGRYYCRGAYGPAGHCDNRPMTIQCSHCIWVEQELRNNPDHPTNVYLTLGT
jgi:hypothetical protein